MNTNPLVMFLLLWRERNDHPMQAVASILFFFLCLSSASSMAESRLDDMDGSSQDSIIAALYASISEEKTTESDWDRFRNLFTPDARLMGIVVSDNGAVELKVWSPDQYVEHFSKALKGKGFYESEVHQVSESFSNIAHVFSTFEVRTNKEDRVSLLQGLNSIQLYYDDQRWWIVSVFWQAANSSNPIPNRYLHAR